MPGAFATIKKPTFNSGPQTGGMGPVRSLYDAAVTTQAQDYDDIMSGYESLQNRGSSNVLSPIATRSLPSYTYSRTPEFSSAMSGAQEFTSTGGYSGADISSLRERGLSPIRAAYANAKRNIDRQKVLQGGYSPNHGALTAKLAREQSEALSSGATNVNAKVAEMVASGKLAGLNALTSATGAENSLVNQIGQRNVDAQQRAILDDTNDERRVRDLRNEDDTELQGLQGRASLFGTTPALTSMFANQVLQNNAQHLQAVGTANQINNSRSGTGLNLVAQASGTNTNRPRLGANYSNQRG